jgi:serpin B
VIVPMMRQESMLAHADVAGLTAVELPYVGNQVSMVLLVPSSGTLAEREAQLNEVQVAQILAQLRVRNVLLTMPRFTFEWGDSLPAVLAALGMRDAFNPQVADFSGMDGTRSLFISEAVHKAFVAVDEQGTEAAAATGVVVGVTSAPPPPIEVRLDQPFAFLIRDRDTGATLFVGRVSNPQSRS